MARFAPYCLAIVGACHASSPPSSATAVARGARCGPIDDHPATPDPATPAREPVTFGAGAAAMTRDPVEHVVAAARGRLLACYTRALARDPALGGSVLAHFWIRADGTPANLEVVGFDPTIDACLCAELAQLRFDGAGAGEVHYPFRFSDAGRS